MEDSSDSDSGDDEVVACGAKYNSIDGGEKLLFDSERIRSGGSSQDDKTDLRLVDESILPEETVQRVTMAVEVEQNIVDKVDHPLCMYSGDINSPEYMSAVYHIAMETQISTNDLLVNNDGTAFRRRQKYGFLGADSLYDAYLISIWSPREQFQYRKFVSLFPDWETEGRKK